MTAPSSDAGTPARRLADWLLALPLAFAIVAEAAWVWVAAAFVQEYALASAGVALLPIVCGVACGTVAGRLLGPRFGESWPIVAAMLAIGAGAIGWLAAPEARTELAAGGVGRAIGANPAGWLMTLAMLRGYRHARLPLRESSLATVVAVGIPFMALAAIAGGMIAEPFRSRFLADALLGATIFVASSTVALALARLSALGADAGFDWRRNPPWLLVVIALIAAVALIAPPASEVAGPAITLVIGFVAGPLLVIAMVLGFTRRAAWFMFIAGGVTIVYVGIVALFLGEPADLPVEGGSEALPNLPGPEGEDPTGLAAFILLVATIAIVVLVRLWMRRSPVESGTVDETRMIDRSGPRRAAGRGRRWRLRTRPPTDALSAYRALDDELARDPRVARGVAETPAEHARRLRRDGATGLALELLAADYALARFGEVTLSAAEDRRAVARWRRLRRIAGPRRKAGVLHGPADARQAAAVRTVPGRTGPR